jgi:hypothetical protein
VLFNYQKRSPSQSGLALHKVYTQKKDTQLTVIVRSNNIPITDREGLGKGKRAYPEGKKNRVPGAASYEKVLVPLGPMIWMVPFPPVTAKKGKAEFCHLKGESDAY